MGAPAPIDDLMKETEMKIEVSHIPVDKTVKPEPTPRLDGWYKSQADWERNPGNWEFILLRLEDGAGMVVATTERAGARRVGEYMASGWMRVGDKLVSADSPAGFFPLPPSIGITLSNE